MKTAEEEKRDVQIIEKIHALTSEHKLEWHQGEEGLTARHGTNDVIIRRNSGGRVNDILLIADGPGDRGGLERRHAVIPAFATNDGMKRWFQEMIDEIDHMARRQHYGTDEIVNRFLEE
jgi:hypothetical protein